MIQLTTHYKRRGTTKRNIFGWQTGLSKNNFLTAMFVNGIHFQEYAKLEYGRMVWRIPAFREE